MYEFSLRYVVLGEKNCGKSWFVRRFSRDTYRSCRGTDTHKLLIDAGKHSLQIEIADTSGDIAQRFDIAQYGSHRTCAILVFDLSSRKSFDKLNYWLQFAKEHSTSSYMRFIVVGIGHGKDRAVYRNEVQNWMTAFLGIKKGGYYEIYEYTPLSMIQSVFVDSAREICNDVLLNYYPDSLYAVGITRYDRLSRDQNIHVIVSPVVTRRSAINMEPHECFRLCVIL